MLYNLEKAPGSADRKRKRVGRGPGSSLGKTSGRGHKGQNSRSGAKHRVGFEGGQMPLHRRLPKRGFNNIFRKEYNIVNIGEIVVCEKINLAETINSAALVKAGLIRDNELPLKVLGNGDIDKAMTIETQKCSVAAEKKIIEAGGKIAIID